MTDVISSVINIILERDCGVSDDSATGTTGL